MQSVAKLCTTRILGAMTGKPYKRGKVQYFRRRIWRRDACMRGVVWFFKFLLFVIVLLILFLT